MKQSKRTTSKTAQMLANIIISLLFGHFFGLVSWTKFSLSLYIKTLHLDFCLFFFIQFIFSYSLYLFVKFVNFCFFFNLFSMNVVTRNDKDDSKVQTLSQGFANFTSVWDIARECTFCLCKTNSRSIFYIFYFSPIS